MLNSARRQVVEAFFGREEAQAHVASFRESLRRFGHAAVFGQVSSCWQQLLGRIRTLMRQFVEGHASTVEVSLDSTRTDELSLFAGLDSFVWFGRFGCMRIKSCNLGQTRRRIERLVLCQKTRGAGHIPYV